MAPNIVLHHAIPTRSCRVAWLLEELGVPYTLRPVEFPTGLWTDEYKEENPNQMLPYMVDGDVKLYESVAIMNYILERYGGGKLAPKMEVDPEARAEYIMMMQFMEADITEPAGMFGMNKVMLPENMRNDGMAEGGKARLLKYLPIVEARMKDGRKYIAGDEFTAADIVAGHALNLVEMVGFMDAEKYPKLADLLAKLKQRPAFAKIFSPKKEE